MKKKWVNDTNKLVFYNISLFIAYTSFCYIVGNSNEYILPCTSLFFFFSRKKIGLLKIVRNFANRIIEIMSKKELTKEQKQLASFAKALGHPIRLAILKLLANQTCCFHGDMSEILPVAKSTLSQHLNELKEAGLIHGTFNPPTVRYCINKKNWEMAKKLFDGLLTEISNSEEE